MWSRRIKKTAFTPEVTFDRFQNSEPWDGCFGWRKRAQVQPGRMFPVDGVDFWVSQDEEAQFRGRVLDWVEGTGVVLRDPRNT